MLKFPLMQADALLVRCRRLLAGHRARAKENGCTLDYGLTEIRQLLIGNPLCEYCRLPVCFSVSLDHRTPIARGGKHRLENLAVCCSRCNAMKGLLTQAEFSELRAALLSLEPKARADIERRLIAGGECYGRGRQRKKKPHVTLLGTCGGLMG